MHRMDENQAWAQRSLLRQKAKEAGFKDGWLEVVCGPMFSGKTEELIRRMRRALLARLRIQVFKPSLDNRYGGASSVVSHSHVRLHARPVASVDEIERAIDSDTEVVGIDEAQFFSHDLIERALGWANKGLRVVVAGLDQDFKGEPFAVVADLMARAEYVSKMLAVCARCGQAAGCSQRLGDDRQRFLLGAQEAYEARCRNCHRVEEQLEQEEETAQASLFTALA